MPSSSSSNTISECFSLARYEEILRKAIGCGYAFPTVSELKNGADKFEKFILLRHDIDTSPRHALNMALLENSLGIMSSFYVLMHSPFYNPGAPGHWESLHKMVELGFEVGVHYDTEFFEQRGIDPVQGVLGDIVCLEKILGIKIRSVSQHRPASGTLLKELNDHVVDAYNYDLMHNVRYVSDSGFKWRESTLADLIGKEDRIHALVHPLTWQMGGEMEKTYRQASQEITSEIQHCFETLILTTNEYLSRRDELDAKRKAKYLAESSAR